MSGAFKRNKTWACPFFKWDGRQEISCEGGRILFPNSDTGNTYMNCYCAGDWKKCSVAEALLQYYETEENA